MCACPLVLYDLALVSSDLTMTQSTGALNSSASACLIIHLSGVPAPSWTTVKKTSLLLSSGFSLTSSTFSEGLAEPCSPIAQHRHGAQTSSYLALLNPYLLKGLEEGLEEGPDPLIDHQHHNPLIRLAVDDDGATGTISKQITVGYISFTLHLTKGWNFITIPVNAGLTAKSLGENIPGCTTISRWNNSKGMFESYLVGISPVEDDFPIENGVGYFIYVNENVTFNVTGTPIASVDIILPEGWNTIGWYKDIPTTASAIAENISNCTTISIWNNSKGMYESYLPGISPPERNFVVRKGMGMFVYVKEESRWICN